MSYRLLFLLLMFPVHTVTAQESESRNPITVADLRQAQVIGEIGVPLGHLALVSATIVSGDSLQTKATQGTCLLKIERVNGRQLDPPVTLRFNVQGLGTELANDSFDLYELRHGEKAARLTAGQIHKLEKDYVGQHVSLLVYETGGYSGNVRESSIEDTGRFFTSDNREFAEFGLDMPLRAGPGFHFSNRLEVVSRVLGFAPVWETINHESAASFRGVHVVGNGECVWVSGSKGTILLSTDGGASWDDVSPPGAGELDFRDIHGFDGQQAVAMAIGSPAKFYRTSDAGKTWKVVYEDSRPQIFFDALSFWDDLHGMAFGDPIDGRLVIARTDDGGHTWKELDVENQPTAIDGEGGFAASGTCLCIHGDKVFIGLGGARETGDPPNARLQMSPDRGETWQVIDTPMKSGAASGVFSIVFANADHGVVVGGTYATPEDTTNHICISEDGGQTWFRPESTPRAYRSCVTVQPRDPDSSDSEVRLIAVGKTGTDYSLDYGKTWKPLDDQGFYAVSSSNTGNVVVAVGLDGRIGVLPNDK